MDKPKRLGRPPKKKRGRPRKQEAKHNTTHHDVYRPKHYTHGGIETIDFIRAKLTDDGFQAYCVGNALKYITRAGHKDGSTRFIDYNKAITYLKWAAEAEFIREVTAKKER